MARPAVAQIITASAPVVDVPWKLTPVRNPERLAQIDGQKASDTIQYHLGLTYHRMGRRDEAANWLRRSLQDPRLAEAATARKLLQELGG